MKHSNTRSPKHEKDHQDDVYSPTSQEPNSIIFYSHPSENAFITNILRIFPTLNWCVSFSLTVSRKGWRKQKLGNAANERTNHWIFEWSHAHVSLIHIIPNSNLKHWKWNTSTSAEISSFLMCLKKLAHVPRTGNTISKPQQYFWIYVVVIFIIFYFKVDSK